MCTKNKLYTAELQKKKKSVVIKITADTPAEQLPILTSSTNGPGCW
jgi:hypothetical protein